MEINATVFKLEQIQSVATQILTVMSEETVFLFYGDMGAGKTTFIKALCQELGVTGSTSSPTFSIVNEYESPSGPVYHFDFYRLKNQTEALDMGYEEYFYSGNYCFIEWPERIPDLLPPHYMEVRITVEADNLRRVTLVKI